MVPSMVFPALKALFPLRCLNASVKLKVLVDVLYSSPDSYDCKGYVEAWEGVPAVIFSDPAGLMILVRKGFGPRYILSRSRTSTCGLTNTARQSSTG